MMKSMINTSIQVFIKNKPKNLNYENENVNTQISDEEWDKNEEDYEKLNEDYENKYYATHKKIPSAPDGFSFVFENKEEMLKYCKSGDYEILLATSKSHANKLMEASKCKEKFYNSAFK